MKTYHEYPIFLDRTSHGRTPRGIHQLASRHYAFEGRAFVLVAASWISRKDLPNDFELPGEVADLEVICGGGSAIIGPDGAYLVEPVRGREELLVA